MQPVQQNTWHVARGGQTYGPYTWEQIVEHTRGGRIGRGDKILDPRTGTWAKPSQVPGLLGPGGAAATSVGLAAVAKFAVGIILGLAIVLGAVATIWYMPLSLQQAKNMFDEGSEIVRQNDTPVTSATGGVVPPEGLAFKGMFRYQTAEKDAPDGVLWWDDPCCLWIYMYDGAMCASFDFGFNDGWPVYLVTQDGSHYVFQSSDRSRVEEVKIVVDITETNMSGTVTNITDISAFIDGTFTGTAITYEQYKAFTELDWEQYKAEGYDH
ncbi:MAG: DUF4339 domain-containing protein [Actinomycetota bacterium]|jgi:hypothetical protein|nr:DUF4339 domain-containing protein [Actinomycetota bacterium]